MPKTRRGRTASAKAATLTLAKPATLAEITTGDVLELLAQHVLRTYDLPTYATWRLACKGFLEAWQSNFVAEEPWLHIWPPVMDASVDTAVSAHELLRVVGRKTRKTAYLHEWYEGYDNTGSSHDSLMRGPHRCTGAKCGFPEWEAVITLVSQRVIAAMALYDGVVFDRSIPIAPAQVDHTFSMGDFCLHVQVYFDKTGRSLFPDGFHFNSSTTDSVPPGLIFAANKRLGRPKIDGEGFYMNNQLELHEQHTVLITGGGVDDDDLIDVVERDGGGVFLSAHISRSDGAIAMITNEAKRLTYHPEGDDDNWLYGSVKMALPWTADEAEADEDEEEEEDDEETIELDRAAGFRRRRTFSFHLRLEKIEGLTPEHDLWEESTMRKDYDELKKEHDDEREQRQLMKSGRRKVKCPCCDEMMIVQIPEHLRDCDAEQDESEDDEDEPFGVMAIYAKEVDLGVDTHKENGDEADVLELLMGLQWATSNDAPYRG